MTKGRTIRFDHARLAMLIEGGIGERDFARLTGIGERRLARLLVGKAEFRQSEIIRAAELLSLSDEEVSAYFFTPKVQKN